MRLLALALVVACSHPGSVQRPAPAAPVAPVAPVAPAKKPPSVWPVPMRVMTWTSEGVTQIGELPDTPPKALPTHWYVEPARVLDAATFAKVLAAVRSEKVPGLSLRGQPAANWLPELVDLPDLRALLVDDVPITSADFRFDSSELRRLYAARTQIDDAAIATITKHTKLEVLDLEDCAITDKGLAELTSLKEMHALNLAGSRITDAGGTALAAFTKLAILDVGATKIGARTIGVLHKLAITELFINHTQVGPEIAKLAAFTPGIVRFDASALATYKPTDADLEWLAKAPNLVEVNLSGARIHDKLVLAIAAKPSLRELKIAGTQVTAAAIPTIAKLDKLEEVDLGNLPVDDASASAFLAMPAMRVLRLDSTPITDKALGKASPTIVELYLSKTRVTDHGLAILDGLPKLEALGLGHLAVNDITVARVAKLRGLHTLVLSKSKARKSLSSLGALTGLVRLYLDDTNTDDDVVAALAKLHDLRILHLAGSSISDVSLPTLRSFRHLDELTLGDTRLTRAVSDLESWPALRALSMLGLDIGDAQLPAIAKRTSLVTLDVSATEVTDPTPLAALRNLRTLGVTNLKLSTTGTAALKTFADRGVDVVR